MSEQFPTELWQDPAFHKGREWGRMEKQEELNWEAEGKAMAKQWDEAQQELYEWANETVKEWHQLGIVSDNQMLPLKELMHELEKKVYYDFRRDQ